MITQYVLVAIPLVVLMASAFIEPLGKLEVATFSSMSLVVYQWDDGLQLDSLMTD